MVVDKREDGGYVTPVECVGDFATFISRIREDQTIDNGLDIWVVSDNLRKGAALNTVQIAEALLNRGFQAKRRKRRRQLKFQRWRPPTQSSYGAQGHFTRSISCRTGCAGQARAFDKLEAMTRLPS